MQSLNNLNTYLKDNGASLVGFADIDGLYNVNDGTAVKSYPRGVSIAVAIPRDIILGISQAPTMDYYHAYNSINAKLDSLAELCQKYLESLGHNAYAQTVDRVVEFGDHTTAMPHKTVAVKAGLGWIGKSALLVTPEFGSALRLTSVLTDAALPTNDKIQKNSCKSCHICANACPGHVITGQTWDTDKGRDWIFDAQACEKTARAITSVSLGQEVTICGKCIEICPYTQRYLRDKSQL